MPRTVVALYDRLEDARDAVDALIKNGYTHADISLMAGDVYGEYAKSLNSGTDISASANPQSGAAAGAGAGAVIGGLGGLLAGLGALAIPGIGPVLAAGPLVAALAGAGVGAAAGGLLGALIDLGIPRDQAELYSEGIRSGGTLVAVRAPDDMADETAAILNRFNPADMNLRAGARRPGQEGVLQEGAMNETHPLGEQPINLEAESELPPEVVRRDVEMDRTQDSGRTAGVAPGLHQLDEGGAVIDIEILGQAAYPPDEHDGTITMQDADRESRRAERGETPGSSQAAGYNLGEAGAGRTGSPEGSADLGQTTSFDAFEPLYRQHYSTSYSHVGRSYEELRPAYAFGYGLANDPRFQDQEWKDVEKNARSEWEISHTDQPWEEFKDAVREAWEAVSGWD